MNIYAIMYLVLGVASIFVGSEIVNGQFLTDYDVSTETRSENSQVEIVNVGLVHADNAIILIDTNSTITKFTDMCVEGQINQSTNSSLSVTLTKMSSHIPCIIDIDTVEQSSFSVEITSDGRWLPWNNYGYHNLIVGIIIIISIYSVVIVMSYYVLKRLVDIWYTLTFTFRNLEKSKDAKEIRKFVREEYGVKINNAEASMLEMIAENKTTINQLRHKLKIGRMQVKYRLKRLCDEELVKDTKLDLSLQDFFDRKKNKQHEKTNIQK